MLRSWREVRAARRKGRRDGRAGVPAPREPAIPFELREILARAESRVHELVRRWRRDDEAAQAELAEAERHAAEAAERLAEAEARRDAARADHERRQAEEGQRLSRLQAHLEELPSADAPEIRLPDPDPDPLRPASIGGGAQAAAVPHPAVSTPEPERPVAENLGDAWSASAHAEAAGWHGIAPALYWIVIVLILVGEFPLNAVAFRLFGESDLFTYVMTASLAVALVAIAHFLGTLLAREATTTRDRVLTGVFSVVPVGAIAVISLIRYDYLTRIGDDAIGPVLGTLSFAFINLLVFAAAAAWSYLRHDPRTVVNRRAAVRRAEREADRAERRRRERERAAEEEARRRVEEERRRELEAERERRRQALELEAERHRTELEARKREATARREQLLEAMEAIREAGRERLRELGELERAVTDARVALSGFEAQIHSLRLRRDTLREELEAGFRAVRAHRDRLVAAYCAANVRARKDRTIPRCFERIPPLDLPEGLAHEDAEA